MYKYDIAISSRNTDFNVQITAVNIHFRCSQMFGQNYKFNLSLCFFHDYYSYKWLMVIQTYVFFVIKPMVELISFQLK